MRSVPFTLEDLSSLSSRRIIKMREALDENTSPEPEVIACVDIGGKGVRLEFWVRNETENGEVSFDHLAYLDERYECNLAKGVTEEHPYLDENNARHTLAVLRHFRILIRQHKARHVFAVGTSALRIAAQRPEGRAFHEQATNVFGHDIKIISGEEEAELIALSVKNWRANVDGPFFGIGGGSTELGWIEKGNIRETVSLPFGLLTLEQQFPDNPTAAATFIAGEIRKLSWIQAAQGKTLCLTKRSSRNVFRAARRIKKKLKEIPLKNNPVLDAEIALKALEKIIGRTSDEIAHLGDEKLASCAYHTLMTAHIIKALAPIFTPQETAFLNDGMRAGLIIQAGLTESKGIPPVPSRKNESVVKRVCRRMGLVSAWPN